MLMVNKKEHTTSFPFLARILEFSVNTRDPQPQWLLYQHALHSSYTVITATEHTLKFYFVLERL